VHVALFCILLTAGGATPLPFNAINADTGEPMITWADYAADSLTVNRCVSYELEPGVYPEIPGGEWMVVWIPSQDTGVDTPPVAAEIPDPLAGACGRLFSWGR